MIRKNQLKLSFWITLCVGISLALFLYLTWIKLTSLIGTSNKAWIVTAIIVAVLIFIGKVSFKRVVKRFY